MKNILLLVHQDNGQEARFQAALDVTRAIDGHLACLDVFVLPPVFADINGGDGGVLLVHAERLREEENRAELKGRLAREDVKWSWEDATGDIAREMTHASELADLIVLNSHFEGFNYPDRRRIAANVAVKSGRLVLAVPGDSKGIELTGRAMIAWDGSRPAADALKAAVPLLKLAENVALLEIGAPNPEYPATDAAAYLSRHDIHARIIGSIGKADIAGAILERAHQIEASYIVMGAFGHSRTAEALLGGVTRSMLAESNLPLLMAH